MIPSHLFHYTTFDTLKLILEHETIRFRRIDLLNDPEESVIPTNWNFMKSIFTSSWTNNEIDAIPMWKMYSGFNGVRIRLPIDLFANADGLQIKKTGQNFKIISKIDTPFSYNTKMNEVIPRTKSLEAFENLFGNEIEGPIKINYVQNLNELKKDIVTKVDSKMIINYDNIGILKSNFWDFENEYRFKISTIKTFELPLSAEEAFSGEELMKVETEYIDVKFNHKALENLFILFGPHCSQQNLDEIEEILHKKGITHFDLDISKIKINKTS